MQKRISILIIVLVISLSFVTVNLIASVESGNEIPIIPVVDEVIVAQSYEYNTICDITDLEKFMMEEVWVIHQEIMSGQHNDNPKVTDFFKSNQFLSSLSITPQQFLIKVETKNTLGPNYDPIIYDMIFWMPLTLNIMNASPEFIEYFSVNDGTKLADHENKLLSEMSKCN